MSEPLFFTYGQPVPATATIVARGKKGRGTPIQRHCGRCGGQGYSEAWAATGGKCYDCGGHGRGKVVVEAVYDAAELAKLEAARAKKAAAIKAEHEAAAAKREADRAEREVDFRATHGELLAKVERIFRTDDGWTAEFAESIYNQAWSRCYLTEGQEAALRKAVEREETKRAKAAERRFIAEEGEKVSERCKVLKVYEGEAHPVYGTSRFFSLEVIDGPNAGNLLSYKGQALRCREGATLTIAGKVKECKYRRDGSPVCAIQRPKVTDIKEAGA